MGTNQSKFGWGMQKEDAEQVCHGVCLSWTLFLSSTTPQDYKRVAEVGVTLWCRLFFRRKAREAEALKGESYLRVGAPYYVSLPAAARVPAWRPLLSPLLGPGNFFDRFMLSAVLLTLRRHLRRPDP